MEFLPEKIQRVLDADTAEMRGFRRRLVTFLQFFSIVFRSFLEHQCMLRASALTYAMILSLVPFLALTFAVLKGLGVPSKLEPMLLEKVTAGSHEIVDKIITYINNTNMTTLGAAGLIALIVTVITLIGTIEEAFNVIWGVSETRSIYRKFSDYLSVVVSGPILLVAATSMTTSLQSQDMIQWLMSISYFGDVILFLFHLAPYFIITCALVFLYIFIPNTTVKIKSALIGGGVAGFAWELAQRGYIHFQVGVAKYNAIYGTVAVLPIFMVWMYTSWLIVLMGVEIAAAHQYRKNFLKGLDGDGANCSMREFLAVGLLYQISLSFSKGGRHRTVESLSDELRASPVVLRELLKDLVAAGYIAETAEETAGYLPARPLEQIRLQDVLAAMRVKVNRLRFDLVTDGNESLRQVLSTIENATAAALDGMTMHDLVAGSSNEAEVIIKK